MLKNIFRSAGLSTEVDSLIRRIRSGDDGAFDELAREYAGMTENAVRQFSPSFDPQNGVGAMYGDDDLRQYAAIALYKAAMSYDKDGDGKNVSFGLYAKICVKNALISALRKYKSEVRRSGKAVGKQTRAAPDPLSSLIRQHDADEMRQKMSESLSAYEREVFELYIAGKSAGEIAERLGRDEKSVSNALFRMKVKIKGLLKNQ